MGFLPQTDYDFIFNRVPRMCVDMVIKGEGGAILMTRRNIEPYKNLWHLPGGCIRFKETIAEAATRIAQKELGVHIKVLKTLGVVETMNDDLSPEIPRHSVSVVVEVQIVSGSPRVTAESSEVDYFTELPSAIHPYHALFLQGNGLIRDPQ